NGYGSPWTISRALARSLSALALLAVSHDDRQLVDLRGHVSRIPGRSARRAGEGAVRSPVLSEGTLPAAGAVREHGDLRHHASRPAGDRRKRRLRSVGGDAAMPLSDAGMRGYRVGPLRSALGHRRDAFLRQCSDGLVPDL